MSRGNEGAWWVAEAARGWGERGDGRPVRNRDLLEPLHLGEPLENGLSPLVDAEGPETNPPPVENLDHLSRGGDGVAEVYRGGEKEVLGGIYEKTAGKAGEGRGGGTGRGHPLADGAL